MGETATSPMSAAAAAAGFADVTGTGNRATNATGNGATEEGPYETWAVVLITLTCGIVVVGTIVGNVLVCTAVAIVRRLRTPSNLLIVSLAVSDLLVAVMVMPFATMYEVMGRWALGKAICDMWTSLDVLLCTASILNLCAISVDRYFVITRPFQYAMKRTPVRMAAMIVAVWVLSALISIPPLFISKSEHQAGQCMISQKIGYQLYATVGAFYLPLIIMVTIYTRIYLVSSRIASAEARSKPMVGGNHPATPTTPRRNSPSPSPELGTRFRREANFDSNHPATTSGSTNFLTPPESAAEFQRKVPSETTVSGDNHQATTSGSTTVCMQNSLSPRSGTKFRTGVPSEEAAGGNLPADFPTPESGTKLRREVPSVGGGSHPATTSGSTTPLRKESGAVHDVVVVSHNGLREGSAGNELLMTAAAASTSSGDHQRRFRLFGKSRLNRISSSNERKATKTLGVIMGAFCACWLPFFILALIKPFCDQPATCIPHWLSSIFLWLGFANSFLNPIIYAR